MSRIKLFQLLALIGVVGFVIDFAWIVPKAKALFLPRFGVKAHNPPRLHPLGRIFKGCIAGPQQ